VVVEARLLQLLAEVLEPRGCAWVQPVASLEELTDVGLPAAVDEYHGGVREGGEPER